LEGDLELGERGEVVELVVELEVVELEVVELVVLVVLGPVVAGPGPEGGESSVGDAAEAGGDRGQTVMV